MAPNVNNKIRGRRSKIIKDKLFYPSYNSSYSAMKNRLCSQQATKLKITVDASS